MVDLLDRHLCFAVSPSGGVVYKSGCVVIVCVRYRTHVVKYRTHVIRYRTHVVKYRTHVLRYRTHVEYVVVHHQSHGDCPYLDATLSWM